MKNIYDVSQIELRSWVEKNAQPMFRTAQVWEGLYKSLYDKPADFSSLPMQFRVKLENDFNFSPLVLQEKQVSKNGQTTKFLFSLQDQQKIEAVLMEYETRKTACISTQSGCPVGCAFCATGQMGFHRNLSGGEITAQVIFIERELRKQDKSLSNIVVMGMGEPMLNYEATMSAIRTLNQQNALNLGARRFTISTVGIIPGITRLMQDPLQVNLAISLHAADDQIREKLIPITKTYPLHDLIQACHAYIQTTHRRITFELALIQGVNDSITMAKQLLQLLKGLVCHVNLIALNPTSFYPEKPSSKKQVQLFKALLSESGMPCTIRLRRGIEIEAGCGQLAYKTV